MTAVSFTANHSKAAVCHFRVTKKRRIATTLLSCSEDGARERYSIICYAFFFLLATVIPMAAPLLTNSRAIHSARLLVSPVWGSLESSFSFAVTVSAFSTVSCSAYFVAGVLGIPLVHYVEERGEVVILRLVTGHAVIDCNKAYLLLGEQNLGIKADLKIVSAETAHILDDNRADFPGFGFCKHCLKSGTIEVTPCVTVIFQKIVCKKFVILKIHINCNLCYSIEK